MDMWTHHRFQCFCDALIRQLKVYGFLSCHQKPIVKHIVVFPKKNIWEYVRKHSLIIILHRPISLYNIVYKLITKVLIYRLRPILNDTLSKQFSAFRSTTDNLIILQEIVHFMRKSKKKRKIMWLLCWTQKKLQIMSTWNFSITAFMILVSQTIPSNLLCIVSLLPFSLFYGMVTSNCNLSLLMAFAKVTPSRLISSSCVWRNYQLLSTILSFKGSGSLSVSTTHDRIYLIFYLQMMSFFSSRLKALNSKSYKNYLTSSARHRD